MRIQNLLKKYNRQKCICKEYGFWFAIKLFQLREKKDSHDFLRKYIDKYYGKFIEDFSKNYELNYGNKKTKASRIIWSLWWQGEGNLPSVVERSRKSLYNNCGDYQVILISKNNVDQYVDIPNYILEKMESGNISLAHLSDYIRVCILEKYGGIWLDATVYLTNRVPNEYMEYDFLSRHFNDFSGRFVSNGKWSTYYLVAGKTNTMLFSFLHEFFDLYWKQHDTIMTYLLFDYMIDAFYRWNVDFKRVVDSMPNNNENMMFVSQHFNEKFSIDEWNKICETTIFQKLSWKKNIEDDPDSYFNVICK